HVTAAWVGIDGEEIVFATLPEQRKLRNVRRDPRIALSIPSTKRNEWVCSSTSSFTVRRG
ncbi:MAG TPA: pyridoxamine 5'-phosphate oxidase family protein, partial [Jiangellaceae bacterium]|nr:pyridoxamine 5'-phosphate oxidase family protein [Jiangellaceae bacterium]